MVRRVVVKVLRALTYLRAQVWGLVVAMPVGVAVSRSLGHDVGSPMFASVVAAVMVGGAAVATLWARWLLDR